MAELVGTISAAGGLLAMSAQLGKAAAQLYSFYRRTLDAPEAILQLVSDLEILTIALRMLEPHRRCDRHDAALLDSCARYLKRDVERVHDLVTKMVDEGGTRRTCLNFAFKNKQVPSGGRLFRKLADADNDDILPIGNGTTELTATIDARTLPTIGIRSTNCPLRC
jgi:hypothetical protein